MAVDLAAHLHHLSDHRCARAFDLHGLLACSVFEPVSGGSQGDHIGEL